MNTHNYDGAVYVGQTVSVKDSGTGCYVPVIHVESAMRSDGFTNRVVIKRSELVRLGFVVVDE